MANKKSNRNQTKLTYTFKSDVLFKMLFAKNKHLLKKLVSVLLAIPLSHIQEFEVINGDISPEEIDKKFCRLDINMKVDDKIVNLEIQVQDEGDYIERSMYYLAREFSLALQAGADYITLPKTIVISILDFVLFTDTDDIHSEFLFKERKRNTILSEKLILHYLELKKLPDVSDIDTSNERDLWLALFNAETEEEISQLQGLEVDFMSQAVAAYREISVDPKYRELERMRAKTRHDEAQALGNARRQEEAKWQSIVSAKDTIIADKDNVIADKDALIAELQAKLKAL